MAADGGDMPGTQRFVGPLAAAWPGLDAGALAALLVAPDDALPVPPASDRGAWSAERLDPATLAPLRERATADLRTPWPTPLASGYARYFRDGERTGYEQAVFAREQRLTRAAVLAATTLAPQWIAGARRHPPGTRRGAAHRHRPVPRPRRR
jgi:hypothetical protein